MVGRGELLFDSQQVIKVLFYSIPAVSYSFLLFRILTIEFLDHLSADLGLMFWVSC